MSVRWRLAAAAGGLILLAGAALFLVGAALGEDSQTGDAWRAIVSRLLLGLVLAAAGAQLIYLAVTGRRRGPAHGWLSAFTRLWTRGGR